MAKVFKVLLEWNKENWKISFNWRRIKKTISKEPLTCPYPEPDESSPRATILFV
jgi:hypothetical protein